MANNKLSDFIIETPLRGFFSIFFLTASSIRVMLVVKLRFEVVAIGVQMIIFKEKNLGHHILLITMIEDL